MKELKHSAMNRVEGTHTGSSSTRDNEAKVFTRVQREPSYYGGAALEELLSWSQLL
jgi:hypothetical protein